MNQLGDLRVHAIRNGKEDFYKVSSPEEAVVLINNMADADLRNDDIDFNYFGLLIYESGVGEEGEDDWAEWYNEYGESINDLLDK